MAKIKEEKKLLVVLDDFLEFMKDEKMAGGYKLKDTGHFQLLEKSRKEHKEAK